MRAVEPTLVATYRREIRASIARVWENVLDWEHLPWLHRTSFLDFRLLEENADHWRGWLTTQPREASARSMIDTRLDRPNRSYLVRTLEGFGEGSEILTRLAPRGERATDITVEFRVPGVGPELADRVGRAYLELYERLWNEDEGMMSARQRQLDHARERRAAPAGEAFGDLRPIALGDESEVRARLPLAVESHGRRFRVVESDGGLFAHPAACPHLGGPLGDGDVAGGVVTCPWHGYRFDLATGANADGRTCAFDPAPRVEIDPGTRAVHLVWCSRHRSPGRGVTP